MEDKNDKIRNKLKDYNFLLSRCVPGGVHIILSNSKIVKKAVENKIGKFTKMDIVALCPSLSNSSLESSLKKPTKEGFIEKHGVSRATYYIRVEKD